MNTDAHRLEWDPPAAIPVTDTASRADQADTWMANLAVDPSGTG